MIYVLLRLLGYLERAVRAGREANNEPECNENRRQESALSAAQTSTDLERWDDAYLQVGNVTPNADRAYLAPSRPPSGIRA